MLEIVQNEEYLAAADLDVLKRRIGAITKKPKKTFRIGLIGSTKLRPKRQAAGAQFIQSNSTVDLMPVAVITGGTLLVTISGLLLNDA